MESILDGTGIGIPEILNDIVVAGAKGLAVPEDPERSRELNLLREWEFPLQISGSRVFLPWNPDTMVPVWIEQETPAIAWDRLRVVGLLQTDSTNDEALRYFRNGAGQGLVVYAETQTAGKGRLGRSWFSPRRSGVYLSLVVQPRRPVAEWPILALAASVALAWTIKELPAELGINALPLDLKWPNDVLISGKKAAGFLLEVVSPSDRPAAAVIGCGFNVASGAFPADLAESATALELEAGVPVPRRKLVTRFLRHFQKCFRLFERGEQSRIVEIWKGLSSMWDGVPIWIVEGDKRRAAVTCGLSNDGALLIKTESGEEETLLAGDVSVRNKF
jgi:BirA family biotin operon repressor/biotin-[acetyl-CoA-carboxylase] ligase